jgi:two-component system CheB/CheR fusion protein
MRDRAELLLLHLPIALAVVDERYDIESINTAARRILGIHGAAVGEDFVHLAQVLPSNELRATIDAAFRESSEQRLREIQVASTPDGVERYLDLYCYPNPAEAADGGPSVVVLVSDVTEEVRRRRLLEERVESATLEEQRLRAQIHQLARTNEELLQANQDFAATALELRSANEEFMVGNQEMQAATEEVETLNEELQATNEELETLNEELQSTVEELNTTNDDLQARSLELQELAVSVESERKSSEVERARISTVLASMSDAVLVVDAQGQIVDTNKAYQQTFRDRGDLLAEDGSPLPDEQLPGTRAARGESFTMCFALTDPTGNLRWFEAKGQPIMNGEADQGGVVVIRDITDRAGQANGQGTESPQALEIESRTPRH